MDEWEEFANSPEFKKFSRSGSKDLRRKGRYANRYNIYSCVISTIAALIAFASLVVSIISLIVQ